MKGRIAVMRRRTVGVAMMVVLAVLGFTALAPVPAPAEASASTPDVAADAVEIE